MTGEAANMNLGESKRFLEKNNSKEYNETILNRSNILPSCSVQKMMDTTVPSY
jgi:hypothetical protein